MLRPFRASRTLCLLLLLGLISQAHPPQPAAGTALVVPPGPAVARLFFQDQAELNRLAKTLDVWEVDHAKGVLLALLAPGEWERLAGAGYRLEIDPEKTRLLEAPPKTPPGQANGIPGFSCYRTVEETYSSMAALAADSPGLAEVHDIGDSWDKTTGGGSGGYDLFVLRLTNESIPGPKPAFFLMAEIHAREYATAELAMRFGEWLIHNYGVDADATWLLDFYEVYILPMANPDGRKKAEAGEYWRKNTDNDDGCTGPFFQYGTDLNRNHSFQWGGASDEACDQTFQGPDPASEPETQALQVYLAGIFPDQRGPDLADPAPADATGVFLTLHSYGRQVLFPWGWTPDPAPNDRALQTLGRKFGYYNGYEVCQSGADGCIYSTTGSSDDWAYGELGVAAYTFELGTQFFERCAVFNDSLLPGNLPALLVAFKSARRPYLDPAGPETVQVVASPASIASGEPITLTATADDTRYFTTHRWGSEPTQPITAARYSLDTPSWISGTVLLPLKAGDGAFDSSVETVSSDLAFQCLPAGSHTLFVESQDGDGNWGIPGTARFQVETTHGVGTDRQNFTSHALPGQTITIPLQITNQGSVTDTFQINLQSLWPVSAPAAAGPLAPCTTETIPVSVTIPAEAHPGDSNQATLTLVSQADPARMAIVHLAAFVRNAALYLPYTYR
jgi:hypothetical protein